MWPNPQKAADSVTFTEEILNGKLHFLCIEMGNGLFFFKKKTQNCNIIKIMACKWVIFGKFCNVYVREADKGLFFMEF